MELYGKVYGKSYEITFFFLMSGWRTKASILASVAKGQEGAGLCLNLIYPCLIVTTLLKVHSCAWKNRVS